MSTFQKHNIIVLISGNGTNLQALIEATSPSISDSTIEATSTSETASRLTLPTAQIIRVISNRKNAYGLQRAAKANIPTTYHNLVPYKTKFPDTTTTDAKSSKTSDSSSLPPQQQRQEQSQAQPSYMEAREAYDRDLADLIINNQPMKPDLVVCAGWMHILSPPFVDALSHADIDIINLHPALPGQFDGANAIGRAWDAFQKGEIAGTGVMVHYVISEVDAGDPIAVEEVECRVGEVESDLERRIHNVEWKIIVEGTRKALEARERRSRRM